MSTFDVTIKAKLEDGTIQQTTRRVDANDEGTAKKIVHDAWLDYLYRKTDLYKVVQGSLITAKPAQLKDAS